MQLEDALENIRHILKVKTRMVQFKNKNVLSQRDGTQSRTIIDRVHQKARAAAEKYRTARVAKLALSGPGDWETVCKLLNDSDICGYQDSDCLRPRAPCRGIHEDDQLQALAEASAEAAAAAISNTVDGSAVRLFDDERTRRNGTGETRQTLSWIWVSEDTTTGLPENDDGIPDEEDEDDIMRSEEILQAEWAKSRVRATCWSEEVMLLKEEMRRALAFLNWRARWWEKKPTKWTGTTSPLEEGLQAYSHGQAVIQKRLAIHYERLWLDPLNNNGTVDVQMNTVDETADDDDDDNESEGEDHDTPNDEEEEEEETM